MDEPIFSRHTIPKVLPVLVSYGVTAGGQGVAQLLDSWQYPLLPRLQVLREKTIRILVLAKNNQVTAHTVIPNTC